MHTLADLPLLVASQCGHIPPVVGWILVGLGIAGLMLLMLVRSHVSLPWQLGIAILPGALLAVGALILLDVPWHCWIADHVTESMVTRAMGVPVLALGIGLTLHTMRERRRATRSEFWPVTEGVVTSARVESAPTRGGVQYMPQIRYEYAVRGKPYCAHRFRFMRPTYSEREQVQRIVDGYRPGQQILVHYDPDDPQIAVLEPGLAESYRVPLAYGAGAALVVIGLVLLLAGLHSRPGGQYGGRGAWLADAGPVGWAGVLLLLGSSLGLWWWTRKHKGPFSAAKLTAISTGATVVSMVLIVVDMDRPFELWIVPFFAATIALTSLATYAALRRQSDSSIRRDTEI